MENGWKNCYWLNRIVLAKGYSDERQDHLACKTPESLQTWRHLVLQRWGVKLWLQLRIPVETLPKDNSVQNKTEKIFRKC